MRAAFLDRDGVLNARPAPQHYVTDPGDLEIIPGAAEAVELLHEARYLPIVVSNQRGIARGMYGTDVLELIEERLREAGVRIFAFYYCPHNDSDRCFCRKPLPGLLYRAASDHGISLRRSVMIGDDAVDVAAGRAAGCRTIHIGASRARAHDCVPNLLTAVLRAAQWNPEELPS